MLSQSRVRIRVALIALVAHSGFCAVLLHKYTMLEAKGAVVELVEERSNASAIYTSSY